MYCRGCGVHAPEDANFCVSCGADLRAFDDELDGYGDEMDGYADERPDQAHDDTLDDLPVVDAGPSAADETTAVPRVSDPEQPTGELFACSSCGAPNSPNRYLCGRCGADLTTGEATDRTEVVPNPAVGARGRRLGTTDDLDGSESDRRWRIAATIVVAGVLIGGVLGAMVAFQVGPFANASDASGDGPVFDRSAYPDDPEPLMVASVAATSAEPGASERFDPSRLVDGDINTSWNSRGDVNPDGVGEVIEFGFPQPVWISQIVFANGDQQDDLAFAANARAKRVEVTLDGGVSFIVNLLDERGQQAVRLPVPRLTTTARFELLEVYPGDTYDDLGLSEVGFRGYRANEEDAQASPGRG